MQHFLLGNETSRNPAIEGARIPTA